MPALLHHCIHLCGTVGGGRHTVANFNLEGEREYKPVYIHVPVYIISLSHSHSLSLSLSLSSSSCYSSLSLYPFLSQPCSIVNIIPLLYIPVTMHRGWTFPGKVLIHMRTPPREEYQSSTHHWMLYTYHSSMPGKKARRIIPFFELVYCFK